ncbi:MAG TPA: hypothetical protein VMU17_04195 [Elusimicrobiota bacterium]|nr:hypothetical protein [Elusimicrobiota bacterium]
MKTICSAVLMSWILAVPAVADVAGDPAALPKGSQGSVVLNWQKFDELWTRLQQQQQRIHDLEKPDILPPVPFTMTKAVYKGRLGRRRVEMQAIFEINVFDKKNWVKIPFLPATVAIEDALVDGQPAGVLEDDGDHDVVLKDPGRHVLTARFSLKSPDPEHAPTLHFDVPTTPMTLLALAFPKKGLEATVEPSQGTELESQGDETVVTAVLPPTSVIDVRWQKAAAEENNGPAKIYVEAENLLTFSEGTARSRWTLNYNILHHGVSDLRLLVPPGWNILSASGDSVQEWKIVDSPQGPALDLPLAYARKGPLSIVIEAERAIGEKDEVVEAPRLRPIDVERESGTLGLEAKGSVELQTADASGLNPIDPQELPGGLWQAAAQPILFAFRYGKPYSLSVSVRRHPEVPVLTTTIDDANAVTLMTDRGQVMTQVRYTVRNHLKQYLALRLPKGAQLWSTFVAGQPVKPTLLEDGSFRIPLAKSQITDDGQNGFPVEVVYYLNEPKLWWTGYRAAIFPVPDAPISRAFWSLYLPEKYRFVYFGGDMENGDLASPFNAVRGLAMRHAAVVPAMAPMPPTALAYRRKSGMDLQSLAQNMGLVAKDAPMVAGGPARQEEMEDDLISSGAQQMAAGVFPVAFDVPTTGQLFHFGQVMVVNQAPKVTMYFLHARLLQTLDGLLIGLLAAGLYRKRSLWIPVVLSVASRIRPREWYQSMRGALAH